MTKKIILSCFLIFFNSKQSSGLNESNYLYLLLSDLLLFRRNQGTRLFYFIVCHRTVIYHFDLIALITRDSVAGLFFLKAIFFVSQWESQEKFTKHLMHAFSIVPGFYQWYSFLVYKNFTFSNILCLYTALRLTVSRLLLKVLCY